MEVMQSYLDFNGPGYSGKEHMSAQEIEVEQRLRKEDESRFLKELEKHRNWPRNDIRVFRQKLDQAQELVSRKNVGSWTWAETAGRLALRSRNFEKAIQIYTDHIAAAPNSPDLSLAYVALIEVHLMQRDVLQARVVFDKFMKLFGNNEVALRACGSSMAAYQERMPGRSRTQLLEMAEQALQKGLELTQDPLLKAQYQYDLAVVLVTDGKAAEAVPLFEKALNATIETIAREERSLRLADALRKAGKLDEARDLYNKLTNSERAATRESAKTGLIYIDADKAKQKIKP
jgi:tetratricopeptide (TPR) repeat protein